MDLERDTVGADLQQTGQVAAAAEDPFTTPIVAARNGGGDYYTSDGNILLLSLAPTATAILPTATGVAALVTGVRHGLWHAYAVMLTTLPLFVLSLVAAILLVALALWPLLMRMTRGWRWFAGRGHVSSE